MVCAAQQRSSPGLLSRQMRSPSRIQSGFVMTYSHLCEDRSGLSGSQAKACVWEMYISGKLQSHPKWTPTPQTRKLDHRMGHHAHSHTGGRARAA